jgi:hypothetical protein
VADSKIDPTSSRTAIILQVLTMASQGDAEEETNFNLLDQDYSQETNSILLDQDYSEERIEVRQTHRGTWRFYMPRHVAQLMVDAGVVPGELTAWFYSVEAIYYLVARWIYLDPHIAMLFSDQFGPIFRGMHNLIRELARLERHERCRIAELLSIICTDTEVVILGTRHRGRIVAWYDAPFSRTLPVSVRFESSSHQGYPWRLTMTEVEGDGWPACEVKKNITFSTAVPDN